MGEPRSPIRLPWGSPFPSMVPPSRSLPATVKTQPWKLMPRVLLCVAAVMPCRSRASVELQELGLVVLSLTVSPGAGLFSQFAAACVEVGLMA